MHMYLSDYTDLSTKKAIFTQHSHFLQETASGSEKSELYVGTTVSRGKLCEFRVVFC